MFDTIETIERGGLRARVVYDPNPMSPRDWDNLWTFSAEDRQYCIRDKGALGYYDDLRESGALVVPLWISYEYGELTAGYITDPLTDEDDAARTTERYGAKRFSPDGFAYVTREDMLKEFNHRIVTARDKARALECLKDEIKDYNQYVTGQVYGIVVEDEDGDTIDSCWGYYDDNKLTYTLLEAESMLSAAIAVRAATESAALESLDTFASAPII